MHMEFLLYIQQNWAQKIRLLNWRMRIIKSLIGASQITRLPPATTDTTLQRQHYLEPVSGEGSQMKRCRVCHKQNNTKKRSRYQCPLCPGMPGLCVHPCFKIWHENIEILNIS